MYADYAYEGGGAINSNAGGLNAIKMWKRTRKQYVLELVSDAMD